MRTIDLSGKVALVLGVANKRSLAWAIADALGEAGCSLALTYQGDRLRNNVHELAKKYPDAPVMACDVNSDEQVSGVFERIRAEYGKLDVLVHSIAYARREDLEGEYLNLSRQGWRIAVDNVMGSAKAALEHAVRQLAAELGPRHIRVNAISAGPVATLSARGISGFSDMAKHHRELAPLGRNIQPREVGDTGLFLASDLASGITGEIMYVDGGYNIMAI